MTERKTDDNTDDNTADDKSTEPPGPADHGRTGGMATREVAPELTTPDD